MLRVLLPRLVLYSASVECCWRHCHGISAEIRSVGNWALHHHTHWKREKERLCTFSFYLCFWCVCVCVCMCVRAFFTLRSVHTVWYGALLLVPFFISVLNALVYLTIELCISSSFCWCYRWFAKQKQTVLHAYIALHVYSNATRHPIDRKLYFSVWKLSIASTKSRPWMTFKRNTTRKEKTERVWTMLLPMMFAMTAAISKNPTKMMNRGTREGMKSK